MTIETKSKDKQSWTDPPSLEAIKEAVDRAVDHALAGVVGRLSPYPSALGCLVIKLREAADMMVPHLRCDVTGGPCQTTYDSTWSACNCVSCRAARGAKAIV